MSVFSFLNKNNATSTPDLSNLEDKIVVGFNKKSLWCKYPQSTKPIKIAWKNLTGITIEVTEEGPRGDDVFWIFSTKKKELLIFPCGSIGEKELLERVQELPGFNNEEFIKAMSCTENNTFACWQAGD